MKRKSFWAVLCLLSALTTFAVPVTFQVDLGPRINTGEFDPALDAIQVRGSFDEWGPGFALTPVDEFSTIYTGTRDITGDEGSTVAFKFVQVKDDVLTWESTPDRTFSLPAEALELPVLYFNNVWEGFPIPVKFQVNMATQQAAGAFDPAAGDIVEARGVFNGWSAGFMLVPSEANPDIYEGIAEVPQAPGSRVEYKFVMTRASDGQVFWEKDPNRSFLQTEEAQELPVVYFNDVTGVPVKAMILFTVDMSVQMEAGLFDPATQEVYIRGNKFGWDVPPQGLQLLEDETRPGIYTNAFVSETQLTGDVIEYKATIWTPDTFATTWEDGANKTITFTGTEPKNAEGYHQVMVGPGYFNNIGPGDLLNEETTVTFRVDMNEARTTSGTPFDPVNDFVVLNGSFLPGGWQSWGGVFETQAFDDGVSGGDTVADDGIYSVQVVVPRGAPARLEYKFGINGLDNEAASGSNHLRYIRATGEYAMPLDTFGTMIQETATEGIGEVAISKNAGEIVITWQGQPGVHLQKLSSLPDGTASDITETEGQSTYETEASGSMGFFRLVRP